MSETLDKIVAQSESIGRILEQTRIMKGVLDIKDKIDPELFEALVEIIDKK